MEDVSFKLKVVARDGILFQGEVNSITSHNELGIFDVLAQHANFISLINKGLIIRDKSNNQIEIKFDNALMKVFKNNVEVYIGVEGTSPLAIKK